MFQGTYGNAYNSARIKSAKGPHISLEKSYIGMNMHVHMFTYTQDFVWGHAGLRWWELVLLRVYALCVSIASRK